MHPSSRLDSMVCVCGCPSTCLGKDAHPPDPILTFSERSLDLLPVPQGFVCHRDQRILQPRDVGRLMIAYAGTRTFFRYELCYCFVVARRYAPLYHISHHATAILYQTLRLVGDQQITLE